MRSVLWRLCLAIIVLALATARPVHATPSAQDTGDNTVILIPAVVGGEPGTPPAIAEDGHVYGLLGQLEVASERPFSTYMVTSGQLVLGLAGASPAVEAQIVAIRDAQSDAFAKVWGVVSQTGAATGIPIIVVSDILAASDTDTTGAPQGQAGAVVTVKFDLVNIRSGPGNRFPPVGHVTLGQVCDIIGRNDLETWYLIDCLGGDSGWIDVRLVDVEGNTAAVGIVTAGNTTTSAATPTPVPAQPIATPVPDVAPPPTNYWEATFYNNPNLVEPPALEAVAGDINFDWGTTAPNPAVSAVNYSARFQRSIDFAPGAYRFLAEADDGVRVYVDGALVIDEWHGAMGQTYSVGRYLSGRHIVTVEYYQASGGAKIRVWYDYLSSSPPWQAAYYGGIDLLGEPVFQQPEAPTISRPLDYNWGSSSPAPELLAADFWSARWVGTFHFETGNYVFNVVSDDGVRVYLNDTLVIDRWNDGYGLRNVQFLGIGTGDHTIRVEYYERTGSAQLQLWWYRESGSQLAP